MIDEQAKREATLFLSAEEREAIAAGEAAVVRLGERRDLQAWLAVGRACHVLRAAAMRRSNSGSPHGRRYADAYALLSPPCLLKGISKNERVAAANLFAKSDEVMRWYNSTDDEAQRKLVYPANILTAFAKYKRRIEHPNEVVANVQRKRTLDLRDRETMRQSWAALVDLYGRDPITRFICLGVELYARAQVEAVAAE